MTQTGTDNGSALGAGSVDNRAMTDNYLINNLQAEIDGMRVEDIALRARIVELEAEVERQKETILRLHAAAWY